MGDKHSGIDVRLQLRSTLNSLSHRIDCFDVSRIIIAVFRGGDQRRRDGVLMRR